MHARGARPASWGDQKTQSEPNDPARNTAAVAAPRSPGLFKLEKEERDLLAVLNDPRWRLSHLYWITDKKGTKVPFVPNQHQLGLLNNRWSSNIILKARQLGFSTAIQLFMLDTCLFRPNTNAAVVAQTEQAATVIFRKVRFAYDNLPTLIKEEHPLVRESAEELIIGHPGGENSSLRVSVSFRSATLQILHVSEFGKICAQSPAKAQEVVTGSLPAAEGGVIFIESTAEGREGAFYEMTMQAQANSQSNKELGRDEYRFHFAPWWISKDYRTDPSLVRLTDREHDYFNKIESEICKRIEADQRAWYIATRDNAFGGDWAVMKREYPSTPEEAFEESQEGVYYAEQLAAARRTGRITDVPYDPRVPVNTFWDLGKDDDTCIWFHQHINGWDQFFDFYECSDQPFSHYAHILQERGYQYGRHYLPHDGGHRQWAADELKTSETILNELGVRPTQIVPATPNLIVGIRQCRDAFAKYRFDQVRCKAGLHHLDHYRKNWNQRVGVWSDRPKKNGHQHAADALRQHPQVFEEPTAHPPRQRRRRISGLAA